MFKKAFVCMVNSFYQIGFKPSLIIFPYKNCNSQMALTSFTLFCTQFELNVLVEEVCKECLGSCENEPIFYMYIYIYSTFFLVRDISPSSNVALGHHESVGEVQGHIKQYLDSSKTVIVFLQDKVCSRQYLCDFPC